MAVSILREIQRLGELDVVAGSDVHFVVKFAVHVEVHRLLEALAGYAV